MMIKWETIEEIRGGTEEAYIKNFQVLHGVKLKVYKTSEKNITPKYKIMHLPKTTYKIKIIY